MKRQLSPTLIGTFVVAGLALIATAIIALAGNSLFTRKEKAVMFFRGSVYGLQVGAPVVFRGVRVGSVESIAVFYDRKTDDFSIPVVVGLEGDAVSGLDGRRTKGVGLALPALVERGLSAQLAMQSLLTGQLYVDLDLRPERPGNLRGTYLDVTEIPTTATAIQALKNQLEGMDFRKIAEDLSAIAASARAMVSGPELKQALTDLAAITATVNRVATKLDQRIDPVANELQRSLTSTRKAMDGLGEAAQSINKTSDQVGELLAPNAPLVQNLQRAADEVSRSAASLREATADDSSLRLGADRALDDLARAARALRDLAETLEQQPDSVLRGRKVAP